MKIPIIPAGLLLLGLFATAVGLGQQTHAQRTINQETGEVVSDLDATRQATQSVVIRLAALSRMNQGLAHIDTQILLANTRLTGAQSQMAGILTQQQQIWTTLASLNRGLSFTNGGLIANSAVVGRTNALFNSSTGLIGTTQNESQLVAQLNQSSQTTVATLRQIAQKFQLLGTINHVLP